VIVAHLDLDAFYAAVEELENPELRSQPLIVGGDPRGRGVVAMAGEEREITVHDHFGIPAGVTATVHESGAGADQLVMLDAILKPARKPTY
jgi:hypothetical protein